MSWRSNSVWKNPRATASLPVTAMTYTHYDAMGRVTASRQDIGQPYRFTYTYNDQSLATIVYPSCRTLENCYDAAGRIEELKNLTQANLPSYVTGIQYHPAGGITQMTLANGLVARIQLAPATEPAASAKAGAGSPGARI